MSTYLLDTYPYLGLSLVWLGVFLAALALSHAPRLPLLAGLLSAPSALASIIFVPEYWQPVRVASFLTGPEDVVFSFASGGIAWLVAFPPRRIQQRSRTPRDVAARWLAHMLRGAAVTLGLRLCGLPVMPATLAAMALVGAGILRGRPELARVALRGGLAFGLVYGLGFRVFLALAPSFASQWTHANLSGLAVVGLPLEELAWALGFGSVWPLIVADALGVRDGAGVTPAPDARSGGLGAFRRAATT